MPMEDFLEMLIHSLKATKYRFMKATGGAKENFGVYKASEHTRSPAQIVNHMFDLVNKTKQIIEGKETAASYPELLTFQMEKERFLHALDELEAIMLERKIDKQVGKRLMQGPVLDMVSHVGQLAMLNGMNGNIIVKESYYDAEI